MKLPRAGEMLDAFVISDGMTGRATVPLTPQGIESCIGTKAFTLVRKFLYTLPLYIAIRDTVPATMAPSIKGTDTVFGPVVVFGRDESVRSLTDFEHNTIRNSITLEKYKGDCVVVLNDITDAPAEWRYEHEDGLGLEP